MGIRLQQVAIAVFVILAAVTYVVVTGMRDTMVYYYTVSEVQAQEAALHGMPLRIAGHVVAGSIEDDATHLVHRFGIEEGGAEMSVLYRGIVADTGVHLHEPGLLAAAQDTKVRHHTTLGSTKSTAEGVPGAQLRQVTGSLALKKCLAVGPTQVEYTA